MAASIPNPPRAANQTSEIQLTHRFAKYEQHGRGARKALLLGDCEIPGINSPSDTELAAAPGSPGSSLSSAKYSVSWKPGWSKLAAPIDFKHAYSHIGITPDQENLAALLLPPPSGPLMESELRTQSFGAAWAPDNWRRVANFAKRLTALVWLAALCVCSDGCLLVENAETSQPDYGSSLSDCALLRFGLEPPEAAPPTDQGDLRGGPPTQRPSRISARLPVCGGARTNGWASRGKSSRGTRRGRPKQR